MEVGVRLQLAPLAICPDSPDNYRLKANENGIGAE